MRETATWNGLYRLAASIGMGLVILLLMSTSSAYAHFSSTGYSDIQVGDQSLQYSLVLSEHDLMEALPIDGDKDGKLTAEELLQSNEVLTKLVSSYLIVTGDGKVGQAVLDPPKQVVRSKMAMVEIPIRYSFPAAVQRYLIQYALFLDGPDSQHRSYATVQLGKQTIEQVLNKNNNIVQIKVNVGDPAATLSAPQQASQGALRTVASYIVMGMEHIWSGIDHLLFVIGLVLATREPRKLLLLLTAFTVGHSLTLLLASLELAYVSPKLIEPLIALSIVYIAVENIRQKGAGNRWGIALLFGLIHGFGFAEILQGTLSSQIALRLFSFNLGVELGQLAVVVVAIPFVWAMYRWVRRPAWSYAVSGLVGCTGCYWFVERMLQG
jgi:hypothetical protein